MKWAYAELEAATKAVLDPAYKQAHAITEAAQEKVDKILEESGWTRWEWAEEDFPGFGGAGPFIRDAEMKAPKIRKILKGLHIIYKYDEQAKIQIIQELSGMDETMLRPPALFVGSTEIFEKISPNDKFNLEELHDFVYVPEMHAWRTYI